MIGSISSAHQRGHCGSVLDLAVSMML